MCVDDDKTQEVGSIEKYEEDITLSTLTTLDIKHDIIYINLVTSEYIFL